MSSYLLVHLLRSYFWHLEISNFQRKRRKSAIIPCIFGLFALVVQISRLLIVINIKYIREVGGG